MDSILEVLKDVIKREKYDFLKRDYERDQSIVEKAFWMNVITSIYPGQKFEFKTLYKLYAELLFDNPTLELRLHENMAKHLSQLPKEPTEQEINDLRQLAKTGKYIEQEFKDVLLEIRDSLNEGENTDISVENRHNYQPYLPSPDQIMYFYRAFTQDNPEPKKLTFSRAMELSIHELKQIRKKADSYFPYYLLSLTLEKISDAKDFGGKKIITRSIVGGASDAVSIELSKYPWEINLSDEQLHYIIFNNYCSMDKKDGSNKVILFTTSAIYKAIRRFRGKDN